MPPPRTDGRARICLPEVERLLREGGTDDEWEDLELPELHHGQYIRTYVLVSVVRNSRVIFFD